MRRRLVQLAALMGVLALVSPARAGAPTDQLRSGVDRAIKILEDPELKKPGKTQERRNEVRKLAYEMFNFKEMAQRTLARHWRERTLQEQEEFTHLFADLLERAYLGKIELYGGEKVRYTNEKIEGEFAVVSTTIMTKEGLEVPVDYRMRKRDSRWEVYDVAIEGISLVLNYRSQFNRIIQRSSYQELVKKMKAKEAELLPKAEGKTKPQPKAQ